MDLTTIISTYLATLIAFSLGIFFVLNSPINSASNGHSNWTMKNDTPQNISFTSELMVMFWAVLNPGPEPDTISDKGVSGIMANVLFAIYQIILAIILLNLLIAMMNATTQKIAGKKLLYWKFVRTSVWMDFISTSRYIPPPITLIFFVFLPVHLIGVSIYSISMLCRKSNRYQQTYDRNNSSSRKSSRVKRKCTMDPVESERRKTHAALLHSLIKRYLQQEPEKLWKEVCKSRIKHQIFLTVFNIIHKRKNCNVSIKDFRNEIFVANPVYAKCLPSASIILWSSALFASTA